MFCNKSVVFPTYFFCRKSRQKDFSYWVGYLVKITRLFNNDQLRLEVKLLVIGLSLLKKVGKKTFHIGSALTFLPRPLWERVGVRGGIRIHNYQLFHLITNFINSKLVCAIPLVFFYTLIKLICNQL